MTAAKRIAAIIALFAGAMIGQASAQEYGPHGYGGWNPGFDWDGFYAGVYGGGVPLGDNTSYAGGIFAGVNASLGGAVLGAEAQLGGSFDPDMSLDALVLGRGGMPFGDALVYGAGGLGLVQGDFGYAFGGGAEYGLTQYMSVRGEMLGMGEWGSGPSDVRVTGGLAFHL